MIIKTILTPFSGNKNEESALHFACVMANEFGAHILGIHIKPSIDEIRFDIPSAIPSIHKQIIESMEEESKKIANRSRKAFVEIIKKSAITFNDTIIFENSPSANWEELTGDADEIITNKGKLSDIVILGRDIAKDNNYYESVITTSIFATGRPTILIPDGYKEKGRIAENIAIAWDGSAQAVRAIAAAQHLLLAADNIYIYTIDEGGLPSANELSIYLAGHNIKSTHINIQNNDLTIGAALLEQALTQNIDMLVMGGFSHSRLRQMVMGGVTSFMLDNAKIPIFLMH